MAFVALIHFASTNFAIAGMTTLWALEPLRPAHFEKGFSTLLFHRRPWHPERPFLVRFNPLLKKPWKIWHDLCYRGLLQNWILWKAAGAMWGIWGVPAATAAYLNRHCE